MPQTIRITITPDLEKALQVLRQSTLGTLNSTELIKMAVGGFAQIKRAQSSSSRAGIPLDMTPEEQDRLSTRLFYGWAKEDGSLYVDNIAEPKKLKPFVPEPYVPTS